MCANRNFSTKGIIIHKIPFKESSCILEIFSENFGKISVLAKGARRTNSQFQGLVEILNEGMFELYSKQTSNWFILISVDLIDSHLFNTNYHSALIMQTATELFRQLIIDNKSAEELYKYFHIFLEYIKNVEKNQIAIYWRFLLRIYLLLGIELNIHECILCHQNKQKMIAYYPQKHGFVCEDCYRPGLNDLCLKINDNVAGIIAKIPEIGNWLRKIQINKKNFKLINKIFLTHLTEQFHKHFKFRSLEYY